MKRNSTSTFWCYIWLIKRLFRLMLFPEIKSILSHLVWPSVLKFCKLYILTKVSKCTFIRLYDIYSHTLSFSIHCPLLKVVRDRTCKFLTTICIIWDNRLYDPKHVVMYICVAIVKNGTPFEKKIMLSRFDV